MQINRSSFSIQPVETSHHTKAPTEHQHNSANAFANMGSDTINISDEAKALLQAKMQEYGADSPDQLSATQLADLKETMQQSQDVTDSDRAALASLAADNETRTERRPPPPPKRQEAANSDAIDDLEDQIAELEKEIEELRAKAADDEKSKEELKNKQNELSLLESDLSLQKQQAAAQA